ncbi:MAG: PKD domain-containing protein [Candidatus Peribacteraceae bacterium]
MTEQQRPVDGITAGGTTASQAPVPSQQGESLDQDPGAVPTELRNRMKFVLAAVLLPPYLAFIGWAIFLLSVLPDPQGTYEYLIPFGRLTGFVGALLIVVCVLVVGLRVLSKTEDAPRFTMIMAFVRIGAFALPGIAIGIIMPFLIAAEPRMWIAVTEPVDIDNLIAPVAVTYSMEDAVKILERRGVRPISFAWDFDGDGTVNQETVLPVATAFYQRLGVYNVGVKIKANDGRDRVIVRRISVQREVFAITPPRPIVDEPLHFSLAHLVDDEEEIAEVQWDFDSDGIIDEVTMGPTAVRIFSRTGATLVSATVIYSNSAQQKHEREIMIYAPDPLPFPITMHSQPEMLVSPAPFQTIFWVETEEPLQEVQWDVGKGIELKGERVGHTFETRGEFVVTVVARSREGDVARLTKFVRIVDLLKIPDLTFDGTPAVDMAKQQITGEVPLTLTLTPRANLPLLEYHWEAPEATTVGSTVTTLEAIYRRPGTYTVTLLAQDPAGNAMRMPFRVEVKPPSSRIVIQMDPEGGVAPLDVVFDASETRIPDEDITGFEWQFGDIEKERPRTGGAVMHYTYTEPGTYTVTLTARTTSGKELTEHRTIVVRAPLLDACFTASRTRGVAPLGVQFDMACTAGNPVSVHWDFGDNTETDEPSPIHVFDDPGTYTVTLTVRDSSGVSSKKTLTITAE